MVSIVVISGDMEQNHLTNYTFPILNLGLKLKIDYKIIAENIA